MLLYYRVLMDQSHANKIKNIIVNGTLIFADINLNVDWIRVNSDGKFIAGSP